MSTPLPSQSQAHVTHAAETIVGFGSATQVAVITGQEIPTTPQDYERTQGEDKEMTDYTRDEDPEQGIRTPTGQDDSFACTRSGLRHSFVEGHDSKLEGFSGDSERYSDSLGFEGAVPAQEGEMLPPPPPRKALEEQIPSHLYPAMRAWLQEQGINASFPAPPAQQRLAQQTIARRNDGASTHSPGKMKSQRKTARNDRDKQSSPYSRPVVANLASSFQ